MPLQAIVIAGGKGTRLAPLTDIMPKPMVPVKGKPMLQWVLEHMRSFGLEEILVNTAHRAEQIESFFGNGEDLGLHLSYAREESPMGTGAWAHLVDWRRVNEPLVVANADNLFWVNIAEALAVQKSVGGPLTLIGTSLESASVSGAEVIVPGEKDRAQDYVMRENSAPLLAASPSVWVSSGWYVVDPSFKQWMVKSLPCSMERDHIPAMIQSGAPVGFYPSADPWFDTGTQERLARVERFLQEKRLV